jgi:hypothetical protein
MRLAVKRDTLVALFAKSGNVCAFPGCNHELVTHKNLFVGQICHIEAALPGGPRYNPASSDEYRRSFENLIVLCYRHHKETDDPAQFDVPALSKLKRNHESLHGQKPFKINEAVLYQLERETESYWSRLAWANQSEHVAPDLGAPIPIGLPAIKQFAQVNLAVLRLGELLEVLATSDATLNEEIRTHLLRLQYEIQKFDSVPYPENPFFHRNWEIHSLGIRNRLTDLSLAIAQAEIRFLEEYLKTHSNETDVFAYLEDRRKALLECARSVGYAD